MSGTLTIRSEEDAWSFLASALREPELATDHTRVVIFEGWPKLDVHLPITPIDGSITPTMMSAFIELRQSLYRTHELLTAGTADLRGLGRDEREKLEFRVEVRPGSNNYSADLAPVLQQLGLEVLTKMTPTQLTISIISIALLVAGVGSWHLWLKHKLETRKLEVEADGRKEQVSLLQEHLVSLEQSRQHDTERFTLLAQAMDRSPTVRDVGDVVEPARQQMIRAIGEEKGGTIQGTRVSPSIAAEVTQHRRNQSTATVITGIYRVARVDTTAPDGFRVVLTSEFGGETITCSVQDVFLSDRHRAVIQRAEWLKEPIAVKIEARRLGQKIVDAVIKEVNPAPSAQPPASSAANEG
ncbi:MAG TPA: hypothetical protein VGM87_24435 [Roseomonas sp.]|jgi:hypothetical protein